MSVTDPLLAPVVDRVACFAASFEADWHSGDPLAQPTSSAVAIFDGATEIQSYPATGVTGTFTLPANLDATKRYTVAVKQTINGADTPYSMQQPLVLSAPVIASAVGHAGEQTVTLTLTAPAPYGDCDTFSGAIRASDGSIAGTGSGTGNSLTIMLAQTVAADDMLTASASMGYGLSAGPSSSATPVTVLVTPVITHAGFDGTTVSVTWSYINHTEVQSYLISVFDGTAVKQNAIQQGLLTVTFGLSFAPAPGTAYVIKVAATQGSMAGPYSDPERLIVNKPAVTSTLCGTQNITVNYSFSAPSAPGSGWLLSLYKGISIIQNAIGSNVPAVLIPASPLDPAASYAMTVASAQGCSVGPVSAQTPIVVAAPEMLSLFYNGTVISAQYAPPAGITPDSYTITLFMNGTVIQQVSERTPQAVITPNTPLLPSESYAVTVAMVVGVSTGPATPPTAVIQAVPSITSLGWNGNAATLALLFPSPDWINADLGVSLMKDGTVVENFSGKGSTVVVTPSQPLAPGSTYTINVAIRQGLSVGPFSNAPAIVTAVPTLTSMMNDGTSIAIKASPPPGQAMQLYSLFAGAALVRNQIGGAEAVIPAPSPVQPDTVYTIAAAVTTGISTGPYSTSATVITKSPSISMLNYDGQTITATLETGASPPSNTCILTLYANGTPWASGSATGTTGTIVPPAPLAANVAYLVAAAYTAGIVTGPYSATASIPVVAAPVPATLEFDGTNLIASWTLPDAAMGQDFLMCIYSGNTVIRNVPGTGLQTTVNDVGGLFPPGGAYSVRIASVKNAQVGPFCTPVSIIINQPSIMSVFYNGTSVNTNWALPDIATMGIGYRLTFYCNGQKQDTLTGTGTSASFNPSVSIDPAKTYTLAVASVNGISTGPNSQTAALSILSAPAIFSLGYSESGGTQNISLSWEALNNFPGLSGYLISVFDGEIVYFNQFSAVPVTAFSPPAGKPLDPQKSYVIKVAGTSGQSVGPYSIPAPVLMASPALTTCNYDGALLALSWSFPPSVTAQTVLISVFNGSQVIANYAAEGTSTSVPPPPLTGPGPYTVQAACTNGVSTGPYGMAQALLYNTPTNVRLWLNAGALTCAWDYSGQAGVQFKARLLRNGQAVEEKTGNGTPLGFTTPIEAGYLYETDLRTTSGSSEGPPSPLCQGPFLGISTYTFDGLGRLNVAVTTNFNTVTYGYDDQGNILSATTAASTD